MSPENKKMIAMFMVMALNLLILWGVGKITGCGKKEFEQTASWGQILLVFGAIAFTIWLFFAVGTASYE